jgi:hypothetical protein
LKNLSKHWNIHPTSLLDHLIGKTRLKLKVDPQGVSMEEDVALVAWVLSMQKCKLSITLQQLKMNSPKLSPPLQRWNSKEWLVVLV